MYERWSFVQSHVDTASYLDLLVHIVLHCNIFHWLSPIINLDVDHADQSVQYADSFQKPAAMVLIHRLTLHVSTPVELVLLFRRLYCVWFLQDRLLDDQADPQHDSIRLHLLGTSMIYLYGGLYRSRIFSVKSPRMITPTPAIPKFCFTIDKSRFQKSTTPLMAFSAIWARAIPSPRI